MSEASSVQRVLRRGADDGDMGAGRKEVGVRVPSLAHGFVLKEKLCPPSSINPSPSYLGTLGFRGKHRSTRLESAETVQHPHKGL